MVLDALKSAVDNDRLPFRELLVAAFLSGSIFLFHFRVMAFYGVLVIVGILHLGLQAWRCRRIKSWGMALGVLGILTVLTVLPAFWRAFMWYVTRASTTPVVRAQQQVMQEVYFALSWSAIPYLLAPRWLIGVGVACAIVVIARRSRVLDQIFWVVFLSLLGLTYHLGIPWLNISNLSGILIMFYLPLAVVIGDTLGWLLGHPRLPRVLRSSGMAVIAFFVCLNGAYARATGVESSRYFLANEDLEAMLWIKENVPTDAVFAVNTYFWMPSAPHGADGGYWIPYFAERQTTAGVMINHLGPSEYLEMVIQRSQQVKRLESGDATALHELRATGVTHIYVGALHPFCGGWTLAGSVASNGCTGFSVRPGRRGDFCHRPSFPIS